MNRVVQIVLGIKTLVIVGSAVALIMEAMILGDVSKIEKDSDSLVKIEEQIKDLLNTIKK